MSAFAAFTKASLAVPCADQTLLLHPQRVAYWPATRTLLLADVHIGKEHVFSRSGIAIPAGVSEDTLQQLMQMIDDTAAERVIILGDFLHATPLASEDWLKQLSKLLDARGHLSMIVVAGNHDKQAGQALTDARLRWLHEPLHEPPFVFQHEPAADPRGYVLSGHIHPAWRLGKHRRDGIRAPVFWFREHYAVLPAFGLFTGGQSIKPGPGDRLYMTGPDCIIAIPETSTMR